MATVNGNCMGRPEQAAGITIGKGQGNGNGNGNGPGKGEKNHPKKNSNQIERREDRRAGHDDDDHDLAREDVNEHEDRVFADRRQVLARGDGVSRDRRVLGELEHPCEDIRILELLDVDLLRRCTKWRGVLALRDLGRLRLRQRLSEARGLELGHDLRRQLSKLRRPWRDHLLDGEPRRRLRRWLRGGWTGTQLGGVPTVPGGQLGGCG
jgi:hypothetical protein